MSSTEAAESKSALDPIVAHSSDSAGTAVAPSTASGAGSGAGAGSTLSASATSYRFSDGGDGPTYYRVEVVSGDATWVTFRRFREFCALDDTLKHSPTIKSCFTAVIPPKRWSNKSPGVLEERRSGLSAYLTAGCACDPVRSHPAFIDFLKETHCPGDPTPKARAESLDEAAALKVTLEQQLTDLGDHPDTAETLVSLAILSRTHSDYDAAEEYIKRALTMQQSLSGDRSLETARVHASYGNLLLAARRLTAAKEEYALALAIQEENSDDAGAAATLVNLGTLAEAQMNPAEAERCYTKALEVQEAKFGESSDTAATHCNLGHLYDSLRKSEEARDHLLKAVQILQALVLATPTDKGLARNLATALYNLGNLHKKLREMAEAEECHRRALGATETAFGPESLETASGCNNLANLLKKMNKYEDAESLYGRTLDIRRAALGPAAAATVNATYNMALLLDLQSRYAEAETLFAECVRSFGNLHLAKQAQKATEYLRRCQAKKAVLSKPALHTK